MNWPHKKNGANSTSLLWQFSLFKKAFIVLPLCALFALLGMVLYVELDDLAESRALCNTWEKTQIKKANYSYEPVQVVVAPWKGRHHVYALFEVAQGVYPSGILKVHVKGIGDLCGSITEVYFDSTPLDGLQPSAGHYLIRANLRSRITLWLAFKFQFQALAQRSVWRLF